MREKDTFALWLYKSKIKLGLLSFYENLAFICLIRPYFLAFRTKLDMILKAECQKTESKKAEENLPKCKMADQPKGRI